MVWYVLSTGNPKFCFKFWIVKVLVALIFSEPILHFEVVKAVEYRQTNVPVPY